MKTLPPADSLHSREQAGTAHFEAAVMNESIDALSSVKRGVHHARTARVYSKPSVQSAVTYCVTATSKKATVSTNPSQITNTPGRSFI